MSCLVLMPSIKQALSRVALDVEDESNEQREFSGICMDFFSCSDSVSSVSIHQEVGQYRSCLPAALGWLPEAA